MEDDIEEYQQLELVAFGCNRRVSRKLAEALDKLGIHSFTFCEYFAEKPVLLSEESLKMKVKFLFPFARWYNLRPVFPYNIELSRDKKWERITAELRRKKTVIEFYKPLTLKMDLKEKNGRFDTPQLIENVVNSIKIDKENKKVLISEERGERAGLREFTKIITKDIDDFEKYLKKINSQREKENEDILKEKQEWLTLDREWWWYLQKDPVNRRVMFFYVPIASNVYLYGVLSLCVAYEDIYEKREGQTDEEVKGRGEWAENRILEILWEISQNEYLPLLIIFQNYKKEVKLKNIIDESNGPNVIHDVMISWLKNLEEERKELLHPLERVYLDMWEYRREILNKGAPNQEDKEKVKDTLLMPKYHVASPGMIQQLSTALSLPISNSSKGGHIPCVLIVGGSGTGKETMAKIIAKYSKVFREAFYQPFNMAEGFYATEPHASEKLIERLTRVFVRAYLKGKVPVVLVFDELNSLPLEVQGTLLRFIENKELPIQSYRDVVKEEVKKFMEREIMKNKESLSPRSYRKERAEKIKEVNKNLDNYIKNEVPVLIIGLMNEEPEKLAKIQAIREILREGGIFAGFLGDLFYEFIRKMRRLREDLFFRITRHGKIVIPELKNRREDLPFLFYSFLKKEIESLTDTDKAPAVIVEYETFEELMDERIEWRGNLRELQALCKTVALLLTDQEKYEEKNKLYYIVGRFKLREALRRHRLLED